MNIELINVPVIGERPVIRLGGIVFIRKGPTTRGGITVMKSMLCCFANFHASCSARVFETKYIYNNKGLKVMEGYI